MNFGGLVTTVGKPIRFKPEIVQSWRAVDWPEGHYSTVTFVLLPIPGGTRLNFTHVDVPDGTEDEFAQGWIDNYWEPMKTASNPDLTPTSFLIPSPFLAPQIL